MSKDSVSCCENAFFSEGAGGVSHRVEITLYLCLWCIENGKSAKMMYPDGNLRT